MQKTSQAKSIPLYCSSTNPLFLSKTRNRLRQTTNCLSKTTKTKEPNSARFFKKEFLEKESFNILRGMLFAHALTPPPLAPKYITFIIQMIWHIVIMMLTSWGLEPLRWWNDDDNKNDDNDNNVNNNDDYDDTRQRRQQQRLFFKRQRQRQQHVQRQQPHPETPKTTTKHYVIQTTTPETPSTTTKHYGSLAIAYKTFVCLQTTEKINILTARSLAWWWGPQSLLKLIVLTISGSEGQRKHMWITQIIYIARKQTRLRGYREVVDVTCAHIRIFPPHSLWYCIYCTPLTTSFPLQCSS